MDRKGTRINMGTNFGRRIIALTMTLFMMLSCVNVAVFASGELGIDDAEASSVISEEYIGAIEAESEEDVAEIDSTDAEPVWESQGEEADNTSGIIEEEGTTSEVVLDTEPAEDIYEAEMATEAEESPEDVANEPTNAPAEENDVTKSEDVVPTQDAQTMPETVLHIKRNTSRMKNLLCTRSERPCIFM